MAELEQRLESEHPSGPPGEPWHPSAADEVIQPVDDGDEPNAGDGVEGNRLDGATILAGGGRFGGGEDDERLGTGRRLGVDHLEQESATRRLRAERRSRLRSPVTTP